MKSTGIVRRIDELGRIVIPKEIRKSFKIDKNEAVEMFVDGDNVVLKKFDNFVDNSKLQTIAESLAGAINCPVVIVSKNHICARERVSEILATESLYAFDFNITKTQVLTAPKILSLFKNKFFAVIVAPVIIDLNCEFLIFALLKTSGASQTEIALTALAASIASKL